MKRLVVVLLIAFFAINAGYVNAQTLDEAATAYNKALELKNTDLPGAITSLINVAGMCEKIGADADDLKKMVTGAIPDLQYSLANNFLKEKKYDDAIAAFEKTNEYAAKYNDAEKPGKIQAQLPKIYFAKGLDQFKAEDVDGALVSMEKATSLDPEYTKAFYTKGLVYKKKGDDANMKLALDKSIELAAKDGDTVTSGKAKESMAGSLLVSANKALTAKKYADAIKFANSSLDYSTTKSNTYLILVLSYNATSKFDQAIEAGKKGLELESKPEKQVDFYFQLGKAYEGKKDNANACAYFKKVTSGPNKPAADYEIKTVLKCN
jgi:tetratricopeptide (TPR) repeat protein